MTMWVYLADRRITKKEVEQLQSKQRQCFSCEGKLLRMAERCDYPPYQWVPNGYICSKCNICYMGVP